MAIRLGGDEPVGVACLGITHPHTSERVRAIQRRSFEAFNNTSAP